jgi:hypothetical protein
MNTTIRSYLRGVGQAPAKESLGARDKSIRETAHLQPPGGSPWGVVCCDGEEEA